MITQVGGLNQSGTVKDPRRKSQSIRLKHTSNIPHVSDIPYKSNSDQEYKYKKNKAVVTSVSVALGSVLFMLVYFLFTGAKKAKK